MRTLRAVIFCLCVAVNYSGNVFATSVKLIDLNRLKPDVSPFLAAGCVDNDQARGFVCPPEVHKRFGCGEVRLASGLGGLGSPIATCVGAAKGLKSGGGIAMEGCLSPVPISYVVYTSKGFKTLRSPGELARIAAPIDTPEEAASLVMALDPGVSQMPPAPGPDDDVRVRGGDWREASVVKGGAGITVRLFKRKLCGCGTHPVEAIDFEVSSDGRITEGNRKILQESKRQICID